MTVTAVPPRILVPFAGDGSGVEELTWGQLDIWARMRTSGTPRMIGGTMPLAPGSTVDHVAHLLSFIVSRHQSLRTRILVRPDGTPAQLLAAAGEVALELVEAPDGRDPAEVARETRARLAAQPFDFAADWPVRMAVVGQRGRPTHLAVVFPHIAFDGYGFDALRRDLRALDRPTGRHLGPPTGVQPMELARRQRTPAARRQSTAAVAYWERLLRSAPYPQFGGSADRREPRYWEATYDSPAAHLAATVIAGRLRVHTGPVLMAAYAVALARVTGRHPRALWTQVSNRFRPGFAEAVGVLVQPGLCLLDVTGTTFDEAARRAWRSQLAAAKHGYYDPRDLRTLLDRLAAERGSQPDPMCYFNDRRRSAGRTGPSPQPTRDQVRAALDRSTLTPGVRFDNPDTTAYLNVDRAADTLRYTLRVDTYALSPADQEAVLRGIEEILVAAAFDPATPT